MSSSEEEFEETVQTRAGPKRQKGTRRAQGACDSCSARKTKCDRSQHPTKICSTCARLATPCTRVGIKAGKREVRRDKIFALEARVRQLEAMLERQTLQVEAKNATPTDISPDDDVGVQIERFHGNSSVILLATKAMEAKGGPSNRDVFSFWRRPLSRFQLEYIQSDQRAYTFPERDLSQKLLDAYYNCVHCQLPILHWPSFLRDVRKGRHLRDSHFAPLLLAVYASASPHIDDDRVLEPNSGHPVFGPESSAGWKFISQTSFLRKSIIHSVDMMDIQFYGLTISYLMGSSGPYLAWALLGLAMRLAIERGMHRNSHVEAMSKSEAELRKRVFWCLANLEWLTSMNLGRPSCLQDEDVDVEYPTECDDEFWDSEVNDPQKAWVQPPGKPCKNSALVYHLKLMRIANFMQRTLYASKKSILLSGRAGEGWKRTVVMQLDSAMNQWKDSLPDHLKWNYGTTNPIFLRQRILLHSAFYLIQIQTHRPFILTAEDPLSIASTAICTRAANTCGNLLEFAMTRLQFYPTCLYTAVFSSIGVLALIYWVNKDSKSQASSQKMLTEMRRILELLKPGTDKCPMVAHLVQLLENFVMSDGETHTIAAEGAQLQNVRPDDPMADYMFGIVNGHAPTLAPGYSHPAQTLSMQGVTQEDGAQGTFWGGSFQWDFMDLALAKTGFGEGSDFDFAAFEHLFPAPQAANATPTSGTTDSQTIANDPPSGLSIEHWSNLFQTLNREPGLDAKDP